MKQAVKQSHIVSVYLLLALLITSCGHEEATAAKPVELKATTVRWITWDLYSQAEQVLVKRFHETYPQIDFKREEASAAMDFYLSKPPLPDLINIDAGMDLVHAIQAKQVADVTDIWTQAKLQDVVLASVQKLSVRDGKQYYVPVAFSLEAIYYNKQIFAQYGLQPPQSWTEFLTICDTLLSHGETPLAISGSEDTGQFWFEYLDLRLNGPEFHRNLLAGKAHYDDARVRHVLETWQELFSHGYFIKDPQYVGDLATLTALVRGDKGMLNQQRAVMALSDTYNFGLLPEPFQTELGFFRFPVMDKAVPVAEVIDPFGYAVPMGAEHIPAAMAFLAQISSVEAQTLLAQSSMFQGAKYAPARADVATDHLSVGQRQATEMLKQANDAVMQFFNAVPRGIAGMVEYEFRQFIRESKDIDRFTQKFEEARQKMVEQGKLGKE